MAKKTKSSKKVKSPSTDKASLKKLKKSKDEILDDKVIAKKKFKKLKKNDGKKNKLKKLKELISKLLKKEKKVDKKISVLKEKSRKVKEKKVNKKKSSSKKKENDLIVKETIKEKSSSVPVSVPDLASQKNQMSDARTNLNNSSIDLLAKEAITCIRTLSSVKEIDIFVLGDKRSTVIKAAESRKQIIERN